MPLVLEEKSDSVFVCFCYISHAVRLFRDKNFKAVSTPYLEFKKCYKVLPSHEKEEIIALLKDSRFELMNAMALQLHMDLTTESGRSLV